MRLKQAAQQNPTTASALAARRMAQEIKNLEAVELKTKADTVQTESQTRVLAAPASVSTWLNQLQQDVTSRGPVAFNLARRELEDFLRSSAKGAKDLRERVSRWMDENLQRKRSPISVRFPDRGE